MSGSILLSTGSAVAPRETVGNQVTQVVQTSAAFQIVEQRV